MEHTSQSAVGRPPNNSSEHTTASYRNIAHSIALLAASLVFAGGILSLLGWATNFYRLTDWWNTGIWIKANTAVACTIVASALLMAIIRPNAVLIVRILGIAAAGLGGLTLFEHLTGVDLHFDTLLFDEEPGAFATAAPGRMGPPAAASFLALGTALAILGNGRRARGWSVGLALAVLAISLLSLTGYWYGAVAMYTIPRVTGIALQTATMLAVLSIGLIAALPTHEPSRTLCARSDNGTLARRLVSAAFAVPLVLGWLRVVGQREGLYESAFGAALRTVVEIGIFSAVVWWSVRAIRIRENERERAEAERRSTDLRMQRVLTASAVPFAVLNPVKDERGSIIDFSWNYVNAAAANALNKDSQWLIGRRVGQAFPKVWQEPGFFEALVAVASLNEIREFESQFSPDDSQHWFKVIASPLEEQVAVWFTDVTVAKRQELELRMADRRKDEFLATLAHELRNPLAPIIQAATIGNTSKATDGQRHWGNEVIIRQAQHMALLLDDLIDVSRITRGRLQLRKKTTELRAIIEAAVETARPLIERKGHTLTLELPEQQAMLFVDPLRIAQVISNLLNNAAKYTPEGGRIALAATIVDDAFVLRVSDTGIGIAQENLGAIFNMFAQVKPALEKSEGGLGIGLALTKGLVELHEGSVSASSAGIGSGSQFTVRLERAVVPLSPATEERRSNPAHSLPRRILLADDNRDAAESLAILLRLDGHSVDVVHDGEAALVSFAAIKQDVLLLDIGMPLLSGYEVAPRIRADRANPLIIAITGWGQSHDRAKAAEAGFDHHLTKPVDYEKLSMLLAGDLVRD